MPPFTVRRAVNISNELQRFAIAEGYTGIPIYDMIDKTKWENQVQVESCHFANEVNDKRWHNDSTYSNAYWLRDALKPQYQKVFNLTDEQTANMTYGQAYEYADAIYSEMFEGVEQKVKWNATEIAMINMT